jgi:hypothetical protein
LGHAAIPATIKISVLAVICRQLDSLPSRRAAEIAATVRILATSREGLGVSDEQSWRVPSLDVNAGTESAAVNLFLDRAQSVAVRRYPFGLSKP